MNINKPILIAVGVVIIAALIPSAITTINAVDTTTWDPGQIAIWGLLGLLVILAVVWPYLPKGTGGKGSG
ncbi:MAG: hypothetical protein ACYC0F_18065 [Rhodanobacter sp.]